MPSRELPPYLYRRMIVQFCWLVLIVLIFVFLFLQSRGLPPYPEPKLKIWSLSERWATNTLRSLLGEDEFRKLDQGSRDLLRVARPCCIRNSRKERYLWGQFSASKIFSIKCKFRQHFYPNAVQTFDKLILAKNLRNCTKGESFFAFHHNLPAGLVSRPLSWSSYSLPRKLSRSTQFQFLQEEIRWDPCCKWNHFRLALSHHLQ